ncbi:ctr copper transporter family protein [Drepanopeziza brunnea f. sp. 'multigermtubi' MB_m1]|uniref:Ctr copper transporter family protein n=1 Tax=Marssonina brunnea f. sp. multigermtubi (strain MB_m1) TaxID=1072389 RepID=K1X3I3_MARBU|nr:ctr copper transporter family protein [Drepanopeziza brunnea f. sp. 'multigermtubi' MB_m1]EKD19781.1 ctr copper transporter family protein [Drepanopeziza brunnea f. sp. 'multigermtubi' MB_m1]
MKLHPVNFLQASTIVLLSITLSTSSPLEKRGPVCREIVVPVTITCDNSIISPTIDLGSQVGLLSSVVGLFFGLTVLGTYDIRGTYCEPEVNIPSRSNTLQLLAHPATYDRNYWSPAYDGDRYSWVAYASKQGYPTFAYDRLGNGNSSRPDGVTIVQMPAQAATVHEMIQLIRAGPAGGSPFPRAFDKIIHVGCSMGSLMANVLNVQYPSDVDATILTGFSKTWINVIPGFTLTAGLLPAQLVQPSTYGPLTVGYLLPTSEPGVEYLLFYGPPGTNYDPEFIHQDYLNRGTLTLGEAVSSALIPTASRYKGSVFVMTGQQDVVFCGSLGFIGGGPGNCGNGSWSILAQTQALYPQASNYTYYGLPNAGHCWEHQYVAQDGFARAHDWLAGRGY